MVFNIIGWVLAVLLCLLGGALVLVLLLLTPRVGVHLLAADKGWSLAVFYGRLTRVILPRKGGKKKPAPEQEEEKAPEEPEAEKPSRFTLERIDLGDTICYFLELLGELQDCLRLDIVRIEATLATGDAGQTGLLVGGAAALSGMIYPVLVQTFVVRDCRIAIDGDFEGNKTVYEIELSGSFRPIAVLWVLLRHAPRLYRLYKLTKKAEANKI